MSKKEYEVGYGKPPRETQFRRGESGNRKGRPPGAKNFSTAFKKELEARVPVTVDGKRRKLPVREVIAKRVSQKAMQGDPRAVILLLQQAAQFEKPEATPDGLDGDQDRATIEGIRERMQRRFSHDNPATPIPEEDPLSGTADDPDTIDER